MCPRPDRSSPPDELPDQRESESAQARLATSQATRVHTPASRKPVSRAPRPALILSLGHPHSAMGWIAAWRRLGLLRYGNRARWPRPRARRCAGDRDRLARRAREFGRGQFGESAVMRPRWTSRSTLSWARAGSTRLSAQTSTGTRWWRCAPACAPPPGFPVRDRQVLALRFGDELKRCEIAERIGVSQDAGCPGSCGGPTVSFAPISSSIRRERPHQAYALDTVRARGELSPDCCPPA